MENWHITRIDDEAERVAKFVFDKTDAVAESVLYRYPDYSTRTVICCSTQSGCPVGCRFCGAGDNFIRSLTTDEIVSQVTHLLDQTNCDPNKIGRLQIMFMSMGEPLLNMKGLGPALDRLSAMYPDAALLISTSAPRVGYDEIIAKSQSIKNIGLQFSIHESTDEARNALIPFKAKLTLQEIADVGECWNRETGRKPFFNYCAHENNSSDADADRLVVLFSPDIFEATVSVVCERNNGLPASNDFQRSLATDFASKLVERGFNVRIFDPAGQDTIGGGCGQLFHVQKWVKDHPEQTRNSAGYGLVKKHAPQAECLIYEGENTK